MHSAPASCRNFQSKRVPSTPLLPVKWISKMLFSGSLSDGAEIRVTVISSNRRFDPSTICSRALALAGSHWWAPRQLSRPHRLPLGVLPTHPQELLTSGRFTHTHGTASLKSKMITRNPRWSAYSNGYRLRHFVLPWMGLPFWSDPLSTS